jgi:hypothetical protein
MFTIIKRVFTDVKLHFTDEQYYEQRKRYMKRQKAFRKAMKLQAKDFCPWSGWYMNEMVKLMLKFYTETYEAGDCCWRETESRLELAKSMRKAFDFAEKLELIEDMESDELVALAKKDKVAFVNYVKAWETKIGATVAESSHPEAIMASLADDYLTEKYTKGMYKIIGEHIWEWCD